MLEKPKCLVSVSGGRSSGMMAYLLDKMYSDKYEFIYVFANTGREREETLKFVNDISVNFGLDIVWVEASVRHGERVGTTYNVVNYETANRNGDVFEEVIKKYGPPSVKFPHCTRELKMAPIHSYIKSLGWKDYRTAIGYRADEPKRINLIKMKEQNQYYPLWENKIVKADVLAFWDKQSFNLELKHEYEGNCKLCYKKSKRKLINQILSDPKSTEWVEKIEDKYCLSKETLMYRNSESIHEIKEEAKHYVQSLLFHDFDLDEQEDCAESCEPF